jgi:ABC-type transporter Mla subunit MlaD
MLEPSPSPNAYNYASIPQQQVRGATSAGCNKWGVQQALRNPPYNYASILQPPGPVNSLPAHLMLP